ncbi:response regulator [Polaromonas sp.]|uniref:response regulator n=1 Tax=Polaromonas sp. TaxID=1869339 RepID=UPI0013BE44D8|nr:response regulator [Polaromonas sp.]NDP64160.1 response regulator [Polaromonas sp.]
MSEDFVGIGEASRILGLSRTSLQKLVDSGKIAAVKTEGGHRRLTRAAVDAANRKIGPHALLRLVQGPDAEASPLLADGRPHALTAMVVEDDAVTAALVASLFEDGYPGVNLVLAADGLEAVLMLERNRPQILITDLNMQPFDGFRLLRLVAGRPEYHSIALVVISSMSDQEIERRGGLSPQVLFLRKPIELQRLRGFVDAHVQIFFRQRIACPDAQ